VRYLAFALFSIRSFLRATCWISVGSLLDRSPRQTLSVSCERNERFPNLAEWAQQGLNRV